MDVKRRPAFVDDLTRAYSCLADRNPRAADRLLDEVEVTVELLTAFPALRQVIPTARTLKVVSVDAFARIS